MSAVGEGKTISDLVKILNCQRNTVTFTLRQLLADERIAKRVENRRTFYCVADRAKNYGAHDPFGITNRKLT
jgi:predicted transcriptional regulator